MAYTNTEITKLSEKVLAAGVIDSASESQWYESRFPSANIIDGGKIWGEISRLRDLPASNLSAAITNQLANDDLIAKYGYDDLGDLDDTTAIRMTPVAGTNFSTYVAYADFDDSTSGHLDNWLQPQMVQQPSGAASNGYAVRVYVGGAPNAGGVQLGVTSGYDGANVGWFFNYAQGMLLISAEDVPPSAAITSTEIWVTGMRYVGAGAGGSFSGTTLDLTDGVDTNWRVKANGENLDIQRKDDGTWNDYSTINRTHTTGGTVLDKGVSSYLKENDSGFDAESYSLISVSEHSDVQSTTVGNFHDKTFINAGSGGLFSLIEEASTRTTLWSDTDREQQDLLTSPTEYLELEEITIDLQGIFNLEMDDKDAWDAVNLYNILPLIETGLTDVNYRVSVSTHASPVSYLLQENQSQLQFEDGEVVTGYTIPSSVSGYRTLPLPKSTYSVNRSTERYLRLQFSEPVKVYGYYPSPVDPLLPLPEEFVLSVKGDVVRLKEEEIVTGSTIEEKVDAVIGDLEWTQASEEGLDTLHVVDSLLALADKDGVWLVFSDDANNLITDVHQYLYSSGREAIYSPDSYNLTETVVGYNDVEPLVVHLTNVTSVNNFSISLLPDLDGTFTNTGLYFTVFINTYDAANDHILYIKVNKDESVYISYTKDRNGDYVYRTQIFTEGNASVNENTVIPFNPPVDPNI